MGSLKMLMLVGKCWAYFNQVHDPFLLRLVYEFLNLSWRMQLWYDCPSVFYPKITNFACG